MEIAIYPVAAQADARIAGELIELVARKPGALLCIAAGHTSLGLFDALAAACESGKTSLKDARFVAMDEWAGMGAATPGGCGDFLTRHFLSRVDLAPGNVRLFDGRAADLAAECDGVEDFIARSGGIDYLVLGVGMNGHIALNEPKSSFSSRSRAVPLDDTTRRVGQKYFGDPVALVGGVTLGVATLCEARRIAVTIYGAHKAEVAAAALRGPIDEAMPASALRRCEGALYALDAAAASRLSDDAR
ncbi:MAG: glucosamine-6-phosphate deaminase [Clostridiales bacterium]|nr:glucosamine-6-phosphate deaminase [Clostridiales bacterium]